MVRNSKSETDLDQIKRQIDKAIVVLSSGFFESYPTDESSSLQVDKDAVLNALSTLGGLSEWIGHRAK